MTAPHFHHDTGFGKPRAPARRQWFAWLAWISAGRFGSSGLNAWQAYGLTSLATAAALGLRLILDAPLAGQPALLIFTVPIMFSAYIGGLRTGLLATLLSYLAAHYYILPPAYPFQINFGAHYWQLIFVILSGVFISVLNETLHRTRRNAELDLAQRQRAENTLQQSENSMAAAQRVAHFGSWELDLANSDVNANPLRWSDEMFRIAGYGPCAVEVSNEMFFSLVPPEDHESIQQAVAQAIETRGQYSVVHRLIRPGGEVRIIHEAGQISCDEKTGAPLRIIGTAQDITEQKRLETRFNRLVDSNVQPVIFWNTKGEITGSNDAFLHLSRYTRADLEAGRINWVAMTPPEHACRDERALGELAANGICSTYEKEWIRKDGTRVAILLGAAMFEDNPAEGVCFVLDMTAQKQAEGRIIQLNAELEQRVSDRTAELEAANKELEAFSYSVSHDLRAPLRAVNGFAGIALEKFGSEVPEEARKLLERVRNAGQRMGDLIDDLLAFSRFGRQVVTRYAVDTERLVREAVEQSTLHQEERRIEWKVGPLPPCEGDFTLLRQAWINLVSNAVKYTQGREPAMIEIGCERREGEDVFFVRDNGAGFDMKYATKLFGVFQRLHRADQFEGTGVGLAIVQRIINRHGGRVWAEADVGRGATFSFTLSGKEKP